MSAQSSSTNTTSITLNCYDFRKVKLLFALVPQKRPAPDSQGENSDQEWQLSQKIREIASAVQSHPSPRTGRKILQFASSKVQQFRDRDKRGEDASTKADSEEIPRSLSEVC